MKVCITGGTGTLGQSLAQRLLSIGAERVVVLSRDEVKQAQMAAEQPWGSDSRLRYFLGDVRDRERLERAFWGCDVVVHAAALKRVDAVAYNPSEVRRTNIEGSANVVSAAVAAGVGRVLMISSDKAVEPTNIYGVSKAAMEHEAVASNAWAWPRGTKVACTRYGNVIGSRGSVVHIFREAVKAGIPIPITDPACTRFWLTVDEAVDIVQNALDRMVGGEIFVPWLPAMRVTDLAEAIAPGYPTKTVGLRPGGEKLHETLMTSDEVGRSKQQFDGSTPRLFWITPSHRTWTDAPYVGEGCAEGFVYRSDIVPNQLTVDEMRKLVWDVL